MKHDKIKIDDAVLLFQKKSSPILFVDTCSILDIIRLPIREKNTATAKSYLESAQKALQLAMDQKLQIVILPDVLIEYKNNISNTKNELKRHIKNINNSLKMINALHQSDTAQNLTLKAPTVSTPLYLEDLCNEILSSGIHIDKDKNLIIKASDRVSQYIPPSRKGSIKDCIIYEHCLEICSQLRNLKFTRKIAFLTSNTKDYCDENKLAKPKIKEEFEKLNIELCLNWSWAISKLT